MGKRSLVVAGLVSSLLVIGCTPNPDPRKGGLFGYSPELYQQRIDEKNSRLKYIEESTVAEGEKVSQLESEVLRERRQTKELEKKVGRVEREIAGLQRSLKKRKLKTAKARQEQKRIEKELAEVKKMLAWNSGGSTDIAAREAEIRRLQKKLAMLMKEAELLGTL